MKFGIIGAAGYIAPRHMKAIVENGGNIIAACDISDSVGILDKYAPGCQFFRDENRFFRFLESAGADYAAICTPNHLHCAHILKALDSGLSVVCEKPLAMNSREIDAIENNTNFSPGKVSVILQMRLHPAVRAEMLGASLVPSLHGRVIGLDYIAPRGAWYDASWKGDSKKSGGLPMNIGIHFFDLLLFMFGDVQSHLLEYQTPRKCSGVLHLGNGNTARWFLSIDRADLPPGSSGGFRRLTIDGSAINLTGEFENLHTISYSEILSGRGFDSREARKSIELVNSL